MGRRNFTVQKGRKKAAEWDPEYGRTFLEARENYDPTHIAHFDATHHVLESVSESFKNMITVAEL